MLDKTLKYFYMSAQLFILFMANLLIVNSLIFLIRGAITNFGTLIIFLISIIELSYLNKKEKWKLTIPVVITIITFIIATSFSGFVYVCFLRFFIFFVLFFFFFLLFVLVFNSFI